MIHAIVFFTKNTKFCNELKLYKLLCHLDFDVFRETGKTVTGLDYFAWPMGPVPKHLRDELPNQKADLKAAVSITTTSEDDRTFAGKRTDFKARVPFNPLHFTKRELRHLLRLAEIFKETHADDMTAVSHMVGSPWDQVFNGQGKHYDQIPFRLALDSKLGSITKEQADIIDEELNEAAALAE